MSIADVEDGGVARAPTPAPADIQVLEFPPQDSTQIDRSPFEPSGVMRWEFETQEWWDPYR